MSDAKPLTKAMLAMLAKMPKDLRRHASEHYDEIRSEVDPKRIAWLERFQRSVFDRADAVEALLTAHAKLLADVKTLRGALERLNDNGSWHAADCLMQRNRPLSPYACECGQPFRRDAMEALAATEPNEVTK